MDVVHGVSKQSTVTSKISWSQIKVTNIITMETFEILLELPKCDRDKVSKCSWKNGTYKFARCRVATNLQYVKKKKKKKALDL